jgi:putative ABC transport system permease protein
MNDDSSTLDLRVVGVLDSYRTRGEFNDTGPFHFRRIGEDAEEGKPVRVLLVKVVPGTTAAFEETVIRALQAIAPTWTFEITTLEADRREHFRAVVLPLMLGATVAGFLLLMVVLGLTGVMWQNVTRRTREIGLRRAVGACRSNIHRQVIAEVMITAAFALVLDLLIVVQLPAFGPFSFLPFGVVIAAMVVTAAFMILLVGACGFYPGWTATRIQPAEALHYE